VRLGETLRSRLGQTASPRISNSGRRCAQVEDQARSLRRFRRDRNISRAPSRIRSRSRKARNPARAGHCPGQRCPTISPRSATRPGRGADQPPPRTTTSTRSRTGTTGPRPEERESPLRRSREACLRVGVGTVAAGVVQSEVRSRTISGTTAARAPRPGVDQACCTPWELGLAERSRR